MTVGGEYGPSERRVRLAVAFAVAEDQDILETLRRQHAARWQLQADDETHRSQTDPRDQTTPSTETHEHHNSTEARDDESRDHRPD